MAEDFASLFAKLPDPKTLGPDKDNIGKTIGSALGITHPDGISEIYREYENAYLAASRIGVALLHPEKEITVPDLQALNQGIDFWKDAGSDHKEKLEALEGIKALAMARVLETYRHAKDAPSPNLRVEHAPEPVGAGGKRRG